MTSIRQVERWDILELDLTNTGASSVSFEQGERQFVADTFAQGPRTLVRLSPDTEGRWTWHSRRPDGAEIGTGEFLCTPGGATNHGPVIIAGGTRFGYADGTTLLPIGTTALRWHLASATDRARTLASLEQGPFSKVRMTVSTPGRSSGPGAEQLDRLESAIVELRDRGIGAELILFDADDVRLANPDRWQPYLREVVARWAGYRNVSWCLAVDVDRGSIPAETWDEVLRELAERDHGRRLRTLQGGIDVDHGRRLITHASIRHDQPRASSALVSRYRKPIMIDDIGMEGDAAEPRRSRTAEDLVADIWEAVCRGGFAGHGESLDSGWWQRGGALSGAAAPRLAFLRKIVESAPQGLCYVSAAYDASTIEVPGEFYLQYLGAHRFRTRHFDLPENARFRVEVLDTWNCTVETIDSAASGHYELELPPRLYNAVRIQRC